MLIGGGIIALTLYLQDDENFTPPPPLAKSEMDSLITAAAELTYDKNSFEDLDMKVRGQYSNGVINQAQKDIFLSNLETSKQLSLAKSINDWFVSGCANPSQFDLYTQEANSMNNKIEQLSKASNECKNFRLAMNYEYKLKKLLGEEYSDDKIKQIKNGFQAACQDRPFENCTRVLELKKRISDETRDFDLFYKECVIPFLNTDKLYYFDSNETEMNRLKRYKFYYNDYLTKNSNE